MLPSVLSVFSIPELASCIAVYLTPRDKVNCMSTCKLMQAQFHQALWTHFCIGRQTRNEINKVTNPPGRFWEMAQGEVGVSIKKNRHLVRTIDLAVYSSAFLSNFVEPESTETTDTSTVQNSAMFYLPCTNLTRLSLDIRAISWDCRDYVCPNTEISTLLRTNSQLTHLDLPVDMLYTPSVVDQLAIALRTTLPRLKRLCFSNISMPNHPTNFTSFISVFMAALQQTSPSTLPLSGQQPLQLEEFICHFKSSVVGVIEANWPLGWPHLPLIKSSSLHSLRLPKEITYPIAFLAPLIENCLSNLKRLDISEVEDGGHLELGQLISKHCPQIAHLSWDSFRYVDKVQMLDGVKQVIKACEGNQAGGLQSIQIGFLEDDDSEEEEDSEEDMLSSHPRSLRIMDLILKHSSTLQEISLIGTLNLQSGHIQQILSGLPQLKKLYLPDMGDNTALQFEACMAEGILTEPIKEHWACTGLKTLWLTLDRDTENGDGSRLAGDYDFQEQPHLERFSYEQARYTSDHEPLIYQRQLDWVVAKRVYEHIGHLTELEELGIWFALYDGGSFADFDEEADRFREMDPFQWDLTLQLGLPKLAGLKKLRHLHLGNNMWSAMGQQEMEFMLRNWPCLERITFSVWDRGFQRQVEGQMHWQWLKSQKPGLELLARRIEKDLQAHV